MRQRHRPQVSLKVKIGGLTDDLVFKMDSLREWLSCSVAAPTWYCLRVESMWGPCTSPEALACEGQGQS